MKKSVLFVFGIGDSFCHEESPRYIKKGKEGKKLASEIASHINNNDYFGFVVIHESSDSFEHVKPIPDGKSTGSNVIDVKLCSDTLLDRNNQIVVNGIDNTETVMDGNQLDFIIPPEDYSVVICGVDIDGIFTTTIDSLSDLGYDVTILSNMIKPLNKGTIEHIVAASKDKNKKIVFRKGNVS